MPRVLRLSQRLWAEYRKQVRGKRERELQERQRQELILNHMDMVERIARKLGRLPYLWSVKLEDLIADGRLGLCEAALRYRPGMGPFEHFAYFRIRGAIIDPQRRRGMRERDQHTSFEELHENLGFIPPKLDTDPAPLPDAQFAARERRRKLAQALNQMIEMVIEQGEWRFIPTIERQLLEAHLRGETVAQIARAHGRSVVWARAHLNAARQQVTNLVKGRAA